jgi:nicotinamide-nucleotide amidase
VIDVFGTVSREVAVAMAEGALQGSSADIAIGVTGVTGPDTDEKGNPVGLVYFGCARRDAKTSSERREFGDLGRSAIRYAAATEALAILENHTKTDPSIT